MIIDEIHLLGEERGPILEVIVSRMRYMAEKMGQPVSNIVVEGVGVVIVVGVVVGVVEDGATGS